MQGTTNIFQLSYWWGGGEGNIFWATYVLWGTNSLHHELLVLLGGKFFLKGKIYVNHMEILWY